MAAPIYAEILSRHYPNPPYQWTIKNNDLGTLEFSGGTTPDQATLDALWPGVEAVLNNEAVLRLKEREFQQVYPIQTQQLIMASAQLSGDNTELDEMIAYWNSL